MSNKNSELSSAARLEVFNGALAGKVFPLGVEMLIGRQDENTALSAAPDISLPDTHVSRRHARIFIQNGQYFLEDLNSTNGTFLNAYNVALRKPVMMRKGSNVQVGETHMKFFPAPEPETHGANEHASPLWQSEIGLHEQAFDFSKPENSTPENSTNDTQTRT